MQLLAEVATPRNAQPLPAIKSGLRLPLERHCLTAPNYRLRSKTGRPPGTGASLNPATAALLAVNIHRSQSAPRLQQVAVKSPMHRTPITGPAHGGGGIHAGGTGAHTGGTGPHAGGTGMQTVGATRGGESSSGPSVLSGGSAPTASGNASGVAVVPGGQAIIVPGASGVGAANAAPMEVDSVPRSAAPTGAQPILVLAQK